MKKIYLVLLSVLILPLYSLSVFAQSSGENGQALEIAPPVITLTADPGEKIETTINLRDISSGDLFVKSYINDFVAAGEDGTPKLLLDEENVDNPYSLKDWVAPLADMTLKPKEIKDLKVVINVPDNAAPGGYYGVVRFTATPPELKGTGVSLSASLGSLILVRVSGEVNESLNIESFVASRDGNSGTIFESAPIDFVLRLKNNGNVHEQPAGQITITDIFNNKVAVVNVNLPPKNILPDSIREFSQSLDSGALGDRQLFGRYTADLKVTYGENDQVLASSITFWVIPYKLIAAGIILLIGGFFLLRYMIRRYNSHIIKRAQKK